MKEKIIASSVLGAILIAIVVYQTDSDLTHQKQTSADKHNVSPPRILSPKATRPPAKTKNLPSSLDTKNGAETEQDLVFSSSLVCNEDIETTRFHAEFVAAGEDYSDYNKELLESGSLEYFLPNGELAVTAIAEYLTGLETQALERLANKNDTGAMTVLVHRALDKTYENYSDYIKAFEDAHTWTFEAVVRGKYSSIDRLFDGANDLANILVEAQNSSTDPNEKTVLGKQLKKLETQYISIKKLNAHYYAPAVMREYHEFDDPAFLEGKELVTAIESANAFFQGTIDRAKNEFGVDIIKNPGIQITKRDDVLFDFNESELALESKEFNDLLFNRQVQATRERQQTTDEVVQECVERGITIDAAP